MATQVKGNHKYNNGSFKHKYKNAKIYKRINPGTAMASLINKRINIGTTMARE